MNRRIQLVVVALLLAAGAVVFLDGLTWGLPSRGVDRFLFGNHPVWSGRQILQLAGDAEDNADRAADVSARPLAHRDRAIVVNATDQDRARIIRRYRLMSYQPDEFTTFAALSRMKPSRGDLDPRMYKYGGLWVYPIGAMLKLAASARMVRLTPDAAYYLDHPEAFGRFYVVARLYSVLWGLVGIVAVFLLVRRISNNTAAAACAALCFLFMPVVVNAAHEAKPHLAGTVLMLLAVLAGARYAEGGRVRAGWAAAILCGAAIGMVPSAIPVLLVLPGMWVLRYHMLPAAKGSPSCVHAPVSALLWWGLATAAVYCITNPYVLINIFRDRALLGSNFGNSSAFYHVGWNGAGVPNALLEIGLGTSWVLAAAGLLGGLALAVRAVRVRADDEHEVRRRSTGLLLAAPAIVVGGAFVLFAAGQPADYARFALPFDVFLMIEAVVAVATFVRWRAARAVCWVVLVLTTGYMGSLYVRGFVRDSSPFTTRMIAADDVRELLQAGDRTLATRQEPAPWSLPPVNLFRWQIILPPRGLPEQEPFRGAQVTVGPADFSPAAGPAIGKMLSSAPISWASKPFDIQITQRSTSAGK